MAKKFIEVVLISESTQLFVDNNDTETPLLVCQPILYQKSEIYIHDPLSYTHVSWYQHFSATLLLVN